MIAGQVLWSCCAVVISVLTVIVCVRTVAADGPLNRSQPPDFQFPSEPSAPSWIPPWSVFDNRDINQYYNKPVDRENRNPYYQNNHQRQVSDQSAYPVNQQNNDETTNGNYYQRNIDQRPLYTTNEENDQSGASHLIQPQRNFPDAIVANDQRIDGDPSRPHQLNERNNGVPYLNRSDSYNQRNNDQDPNSYFQYQRQRGQQGLPRSVPIDLSVNSGLPHPTVESDAMVLSTINMTAWPNQTVVANELAQPANLTKTTKELRDEATETILGCAQDYYVSRNLLRVLHNPVKLSVMNPTYNVKCFATCVVIRSGFYHHEDFDIERVVEVTVAQGKPEKVVRTMAARCRQLHTPGATDCDDMWNVYKCFHGSV